MKIGFLKDATSKTHALVLVILALLSPAWLTASEQPRIVATTSMLADAARQLSEDFAQVNGLMAEGVDPHLYRPTRNDLVLLQRADIIFYNGMHLEGRMGDTLNRISRRGKSVHAIAEAVFAASDREPLLEDEDGLDPHIWMDVNLWREAVARMAKILADEFPQQAEVIRNNHARYDAELLLLEAYAREVLTTIPQATRVLVTAHDAFGYLGEAYAIEVRGIQGISTESEAGLRDIVQLIDFIVERDIPAIFVETSVADKNVRALIEGARSRGHQLVIGGELFSDAMGPRGHWTGTYIGMIDHNVSTIAAALGGTVPEGGFRQWRENH
jgi:manganese/zinc/iron transport system substrate-binding protein